MLYVLPFRCCCPVGMIPTILWTTTFVRFCICFVPFLNGDCGEERLFGDLTNRLTIPIVYSFQCWHRRNHKTRSLPPCSRRWPSGGNKRRPSNGKIRGYR
uniref:Putative secreted protein n=1 Tax=Anopheles triannulatus TaxID=58253 RepID=A0A2M4B3Y4_9DIPT